MRKKSCRDISQVNPIERFLNILMFLFGVFLLLPYETFSNQNYSGMKMIANENIWGTICILIVVYMLIIRNMKIPIRYKIIGFSIQTALWSFVGTMLLISNFINHNVSTGGSTYLCIAGLSLYVTYIMGGDS